MSATSSGTPTSDRIPFSRRIGFRTSAWSTSSITTGRADRRDAAGEALADRNADSLLDLFLEAAGGARDEHLAVLVEQEDGDRVRVQELLDSQQVVGEQLLERALGPSDVFDGRSPRAGFPAPHPVIHAPHGIGALWKRLYAEASSSSSSAAARSVRRSPSESVSSARGESCNAAGAGGLEHLDARRRGADVDDPPVVRVLLRARTRPAASSPCTVRVMVGGRTRSASASRPRLSGPPKTTTESAESAGPPRPEAASSRATRRST